MNRLRRQSRRAERRACRTSLFSDRLLGGAGVGAAPATGAERGQSGRGCRILVVFFLLLVVAVAGCATVDPWEDARIESEVKARLVAEEDANLTRLEVMSRQATVYLRGRVESARQRALAETLARDVRGVRRVVNGLEIRAAPD